MNTLENIKVLFMAGFGPIVQDHVMAVKCIILLSVYLSKKWKNWKDSSIQYLYTDVQNRGDTSLAALYHLKA